MGAILQFNNKLETVNVIEFKNHKYLYMQTQIYNLEI